MSFETLWRAIALGLAALILTSCVAVVEEIPPTEPGFCTREYAPVCATRGNRERTFGNACEARRAGWAIESRGECERIIVQPPRPEPLLCPQIYQPVCATRNGRTRTFGNSCEADASGWRVVARGECRRVITEPVIEPPRNCTREYRPVCAVRGNREQTFENSCVAQSEGWRVVDEGACGRDMIQ